MEPYTILGLIAAICTTISFVPQAIRVIKTKQTRDISLGMYLIFSTGTFLWLLYGIFTKDIPIIAANSITFIFSFTILALKLKYK
jgi:MtN3 and saliva related transmembrane protein